MYALTLDRFNDDGSVSVRHVFYGETEDGAEKVRDQHVKGCKALTAAVESGRVGEYVEEIDEDDAPSEDDYEEDDEDEGEEEE
jgi:hypothetical protein